MKQYFRRDIKSLDFIFDTIHDFAKENKVHEKIIFVLNLATEEIFTNMIKYNSKNQNDILIEFNNDVIDVFIMNQTRDLLTTSQYKVLTSAYYDQPCEEDSPHPYDGFPYGIFTAAFCNGCGYDDGVYYADSNLDTKITLDEIYEHIRDFVITYFGFDQNVQVFPEDSNFTIVEH